MIARGAALQFQSRENGALVGTVADWLALGSATGAPPYLFTGLRLHGHGFGIGDLGFAHSSVPRCGEAIHAAYLASGFVRKLRLALLTRYWYGVSIANNTIRTKSAKYSYTWKVIGESALPTHLHSRYGL